MIIIKIDFQIGGYFMNAIECIKGRRVFVITRKAVLTIHY